MQDSSINASGCKFKSDRRSGCVLFGRSSAVIDNSEIFDCYQHGLCLRGSAVVRLANTSFQRCGVRAVYGYGCADIDMDSCLIEGTLSQSSSAVELLQRADAPVSSWRKLGKSAPGNNATLSLRSAHHSDARARIRMKNCIVRANSGRGMLVTKSDPSYSPAILEGCVFEGNLMGDFDTVLEDSPPEGTQFDGPFVWKFECDGCVYRLLMHLYYHPCLKYFSCAGQLIRMRCDGSHMM